MSMRNAIVATLRWAAFNRRRSLIICASLTGACLAVELAAGDPVDGLFAASGAFFTLGGFLLGIKNSAFFHRVNPDGSPWGLAQKYWSMRGAFGFVDPVSEEEMKSRVNPVELDELWGCGMVFLGTLLWGFGSFVLRLLPV